MNSMMSFFDPNSYSAGYNGEQLFGQIYQPQSYFDAMGIPYAVPANEPSWLDMVLMATPIGQQYADDFILRSMPAPRSDFQYWVGPSDGTVDYTLVPR